MANTFKNAGGIIGTALSTVYTCPAATQAVVHALYVANVDGALSADVDIVLFDASANATRRLGFKIPVPAGGTLGFDKPINLEPGDQLRLQASAANALESNLSILEVS